MKAVLLLIGFILASIHFAEAQQSSKVSRIGFLFASNPSATVGRIQAFRQGLHERGYVEGKSILIEIVMERENWIVCPLSLVKSSVSKWM